MVFGIFLFAFRALDFVHRKGARFVPTVKYLVHIAEFYFADSVYGYLVSIGYKLKGKVLFRKPIVNLLLLAGSKGTVAKAA